MDFRFVGFILMVGGIEIGGGIGLDADSDQQC